MECILLMQSHMDEDAHAWAAAGYAQVQSLAPWYCPLLPLHLQLSLTVAKWLKFHISPVHI